MFKKVNITKNNIVFMSRKRDKDVNNDETRLLSNTPQIKLKQGFQKTTSAIGDYPIRGLKGDVNSNFYNFLTMGIVPYILGSSMFMLIFNAANKYQTAFDKSRASVYGKKMALGVILWGVFKNLSQNIVTKSIKAGTGVDIDMPYENIVYFLPTEAGQAANIDVQHQQRTVYDSKEFFRKDLLNKEYFDKIAKKIGLGDSLNDSVTETTPIIQNIVATANTAKSISGYLWAGIGVALATQDSWLDFFKSFKNIKSKDSTSSFKTFLKNSVNLTKSFIKTFKNAFVQLWSGKESNGGYMRHAGKTFLITSLLATSYLVANSIIRAKDIAKCKNDTFIDNTKESTVI